MIDPNDFRPPRRMMRGDIPVDGEWHRRSTGGPIVHVSCRLEDTLEFWWIEQPENERIHHRLRVVTSYKDVGAEWAYLGTTITPSRRHAWHLFRTDDPKTVQPSLSRPPRSEIVEDFLEVQRQERVTALLRDALRVFNEVRPQLGVGTRDRVTELMIGIQTTLSNPDPGEENDDD